MSYYVAVSHSPHNPLVKGFVSSVGGYTPDIRIARAWPTFAQADMFAKHAGFLAYAVLSAC